MIITFEPEQSQELYNKILGKRGMKSFSIFDVNFNEEQLEQVFEIVANNRAHTRGTKLYLHTDNDTDVFKIEYDEVNLKANDIPKPRPKNTF